jgi:hypothetical protein
MANLACNLIVFRALSTILCMGRLIGSLRGLETAQQARMMGPADGVPDTCFCCRVVGVCLLLWGTSLQPFVAIVLLGRYVRSYVLLLAAVGQCAMFCVGWTQF